MAQQSRLTCSKRHLKWRGAVLGNGMHTLEQAECCLSGFVELRKLHVSPSFIVFCLRVGLALYKVRRLGRAAHQPTRKPCQCHVFLCISFRTSVGSHERGSEVSPLSAMRVEVVCASICLWRPDDGNFRINTLRGTKSSEFSCRCLAP